MKKKAKKKRQIKKKTTKKRVQKKEKKPIGKKVIEVKPTSLGKKRTCHECGTKFYDFEKKDISCPKCKKPYDFSRENEKIPRKPHSVHRTVKPKKIDEAAVLLEEVGLDDVDSVDDLDSFDDEDEKMVDEFELDEKEESEF